MIELTQDDLAELVSWPDDSYNYSDSGYQRLVSAGYVEKEGHAFKLTERGFHLRKMIHHLCHLHQK